MKKIKFNTFNAKQILKYSFKELKLKLTPFWIAIMLMIIAFAMINIFLTSKGIKASSHSDYYSLNQHLPVKNGLIDTSKLSGDALITVEKNVKDLIILNTKTQIIQALSIFSTFWISSRFTLTFKDKINADRDRAQFLYSNKNIVTFNKIFIDALILFIGYIIILIFSSVWTTKMGTGLLSGNIILWFFKFSIPTIFIYIIGVFGIRYFNSLQVNKPLKYTFLIIWTFLTLVLFMTYSYLMGIKVIREYILASKWIYFVPIVNFVLPYISIYKDIPAYYYIPLILTIIITLILWWKSYVRVTKFYLCG